MERQRLDYLDGLRGLAAIVVVIGHCLGQTVEHAPLLHGAEDSVLQAYLKFHGFSVPLFICLSGFVLALPAVNSLKLRGGVCEFMKRRAWRILPGYYFALTFSFFVAEALGDIDVFHSARPLHDIAKMLISPALLMQDIWGDSSSINAALWSLPVEWHAYMLLPTLLLAWANWGLPIAASCFSVIALLLFYLHPQFATTLDVVFIFGVLAAWIIRSTSRRAEVARSTLPWLVLLGLCCAGFAMVLSHCWLRTCDQYHDTYYLIWGVISALLIVSIALGRLYGLRALLDSMPFQWLGERSYSIYLLHWPILLIARKILLVAGITSFGFMFLAFLATVIPTTLLIASLSWWYLERLSTSAVPLKTQAELAADRARRPT